MKMMGNLFTLPGVDGQGVIPHWDWCQTRRGEGCPLVILSLQMMTEHPVMPLIMTGLFVGGVEVEAVKRAEVAAPPEGGERRRMDFLVRSRFPNLVVRRDILMM